MSEYIDKTKRLRHALRMYESAGRAFAEGEVQVKFDGVPVNLSEGAVRLIREEVVGAAKAAEVAAWAELVAAAKELSNG